MIMDDQCEAVAPKTHDSLNAHLVCLNFKVPLQVRQRFKIYAAAHRITMTKLLIQLLDEQLKMQPPQLTQGERM
jgi:hypothetical protein